MYFILLEDMSNNETKANRKIKRGIKKISRLLKSDYVTISDIITYNISSTHSKELKDLSVFDITTITTITVCSIQTYATSNNR